MGGLLLGAIAPGAPTGISVEDYETIECDYSRGPLYRLSAADLVRFERAMEKRSDAGKMQVVGFFRSHTRKGLLLDAEDLQFLEARFDSPHSIALLVRPFATRASVAGIFLREEGGFISEASALEFPFRTAQLTPSKRAPVVTPPATRAQVVPIATRREIPAPFAALAVAAPPEPVGQSLAELAAEETKPVSAAPAAMPSTGMPPAVVKAAEIPVAPQEAPSASPTANVVAAPTGAGARVFESDVTGPELTLADAPAFAEAKPASKVPMLTGLLAAALLGFVLLFIYPGFLNHFRRASESAPQDSSPLTLSVEHSGTDLLLTWNRESAAVRNASQATLSILDGDRHETYNMDLVQLRTGRILYSPMGGDVSFQLEAIGKDGSHTVTETLRMLRTRPSPMPDEGSQGRTEKSGNVTASSLTSQSTMPGASFPDSAATNVSAVEGPKLGAAPVKAFDVSSLAQRLRPAQQGDLAENPSPAAGGPVTPRVNAEVPLSFASMTAAPGGPSSVASSRASAPVSVADAADRKSNSSAGGQIQAAQLISRKDPEYPPLARQIGAKGEVELTATIGTDGSVKAVRVVKGHPLLVKAAQDAVMQWRYRPTLLNGVAIQSDTKITLNFSRQQ
jgi:TonB family protein